MALPECLKGDCAGKSAEDMLECQAGQSMPNAVACYELHTAQMSVGPIVRPSSVVSMPDVAPGAQRHTRPKGIGR